MVISILFISVELYLDDVFHGLFKKKSHLGLAFLANIRQRLITFHHTIPFHIVHFTVLKKKTKTDFFPVSSITTTQLYV